MSSWNDRMNIIGQNGNDGTHYKAMPDVPVAYMKGQYPPDEKDVVHNPDHYTEGGIEVKDYIIAKYGLRAWYHKLICDAQKYLSRFPKKGTPLLDLSKASNCIQMAAAILADHPEYLDVEE